MVVGLGGPSDLLENDDAHLPKANHLTEVKATEDGYISAIDTRNIGLSVVELGGGRMRADQSIDHSVGLTDIVELGQKISKGETLCLIHSKSQADATVVTDKVSGSFHLSREAVELAPLVVETIR
jgi:thymidine phosphorylase